jgi:hypothetical protein
MTGPQGRASRVRKARGESCCGLCGSPVRPGQLIGLVDDRWWCHVSCVIRRSDDVSSRNEYPEESPNDAL